MHYQPAFSFLTILPFSEEKKSLKKVSRMFKVLTFTFFSFFLLAGSTQADSTTDLLLRFIDKNNYEVNLYNTTGQTAGKDSALLTIRTRSSKPPQVLSLDNPGRVVVDIPDVLARQTYTLPAKVNPLVKAVRIGAHANKLRVVLDLADQVSPTAFVRRLGTEIEIRVGSYQATPLDTVILPSKEEQMQTIELAGPETTATPFVTTLPEKEPAPIQETVPAVATPTSQPTQAPIEPPAVVSVKRAAPVKPIISPAPTIEPQFPDEKAEITPTPQLEQQAAAPAAETPTPLPEAAGTRATDTASTIILPKNLPPPQELLKFSVDKVFLTFEPGQRPVQNITVKNKTLQPLYLTLKVEKVMAPGTANEKAVETVELVASPKRLELSPERPRTVRVLLNQWPREAESVYRISLLPQAETFDETLIQAQVSGKPTTLRLVTGLALTVDALPSLPRHTASWEIKGDLITIGNSGNSSFVLESGRFCSPDGSRCAPIPNKRLYAGTSWVIRIPGRGTLEFLKRAGVDFEPLVISTEDKKQ